MKDNTFFEAPRLRLDGIYISKCVYLRRVRDVGNIHLDDRRRRTLQQLQQQLQQQLRQPTGAPISQELINNLAANSPVVAVTYYRYLRFLPNNRVLVLRSEAEKQVAVAALKCVEARLEGKPDSCKAALAPSRAPALQGAPLPDQVVLGLFDFDTSSKTVTLEYPGRSPAAAAAAADGAAAAATAAAAGNPQQRGGRSRREAAAGAVVGPHEDSRGPPNPRPNREASRGGPPSSWGAPSNLGAPNTRGAPNNLGAPNSLGAPSSLGAPRAAPVHTAVLQLAHVKGGWWNSKLKWISLSVTSNTHYGPDESFIDVENENFRPFLFHRVISFQDYF
ncbi:hypothetical protein, conserved [Eimeria tenella]|uniref:Uncharacterized protein n=1 Tax=Eimeria tenella TaxID=5802 RepID=U6KSA5_EIMTE|nr:hypothetical protein, conserved [Eimeria tenella]CDJ40856.1 hypothetical protein, conserved [Eimeria tenella]|eukprot:XP_013231606.1 hypothetical protein, conserved [Eimeria tenella]